MTSPVDDQDFVMTLRLKMRAINTIMEALDKAPKDTAGPVISDIEEQCLAFARQHEQAEVLRTAPDRDFPDPVAPAS